MTTVMEDVDYDRKNFNFDPLEYRHPHHMTEEHYIYHLYREETSGFMYCSKNAQGKFIKSPRTLSALCIYKLISDPSILKQVKGHDLPSNLYPSMLSEAIYQREVHSIEYLISTWPNSNLKVYDVLPLEDYLETEYLTTPLEGLSTTLLDCFMLGLLNLQPEARLRHVDFTGFEKDRKLCRELLRLPIIWMSSEMRSVETMHDHLSTMLDITKDKVERYLNRIGVIYSNYDNEFKHGNDIGVVTIMLDCKMTLDDVPIGLALQKITPFKFVCNKLWIESIQDVYLDPSKVSIVLNAQMITHLEVENQSISHESAKLENLLTAISLMPNLTALGLPGSLDTDLLQYEAYSVINKALQKIPFLKRLNLSSCNLQNHLGVILSGMLQSLSYLNLRDCRLTECDMWFLLQFEPVATLRELNLSRNNLQSLEYVCHALIDSMPFVTCFFISYCQLGIPATCRIMRKCINLACLKILSLQSFVPPPFQDLRDILYDCARIDTLQKGLLLPAIYAFPGSNEEARETNKTNLLNSCYRYLQRKSRPDIALE